MELWSMSQSVTPAQKPRSVLSARRLVLMASAAVLGAGVLFSGAEFAVKPSVISVRGKVDGGRRTMSFDGGDSPFPPGSPMERFFRRFGMPDGQDSDRPRGPRARNFTMG